MSQGLRLPFWFQLNPYRQIPETISKKRALTQGISRKLFPDFFQISQFRVMREVILRKLFPFQLHEYLPIKKYVFPKTGHDSEAFPETFSNIWKSLISEKVSRKSPESCPESLPLWVNLRNVSLVKFIFWAVFVQNFFPHPSD